MKESRKIIRRERFVRLASYRTNEVLERLRVLGNCSNKSAYRYTPEDIQRIFSEIDRQVKETRARFGIRRQREKFILRDDE